MKAFVKLGWIIKVKTNVNLQDFKTLLAIRVPLEDIIFFG
jgi:hypothetical protein